MSEAALKSSTAAAGSTVNSNTSNGSVLDCSKASTGVWLVKVPNYLAKKWHEAPDNSEVGLIRITQSKVANKPKQEVVFHLNDAIAKTTSATAKEKIPIEHKFVMAPLGSQDIFILRQSEENSKEVLSVIGKVMQRAECTPVQNDSSYIQLKRESVKKFTEPKRQIQLADDYIARQHFLPKSTHAQNMERKDKTKRLRKDKEQVLDLLFNAFNKHQFYTIKDLVKLTLQPQSYLKEILHEICKYNATGMHKNTWQLKEEYKQTDLTSESKKKAAVASLEKEAATQKRSGAAAAADDFMDDDEDDDDDDDFDDDDDMELI